MGWCSYCGRDQVVEHNDGFICCTGCGRVLDDNVFSSDPTFAKGANGQSVFVGNIVRNGQYSSHTRIVDGGSGTYSGYQSNSHQRTLDKGKNEIKDIAASLSVSGGDDTVAAAHRIYVIAVERNFTRGRRTSQVAAACLYIVCRQGNKPYLLIDFSDRLQISVYVLGAVFLQLCTLLRLDQHPMVQKPVDPSLYIHRFTDRLLQKIKPDTTPKLQFAVANTALRIVASMKHDWMQTGRRPSGICGAALLLSARIHGIDCSKADVESVVYVCKATITKRLVEFSNTEAGSLTPEEFELRAKAREQELVTTSHADIGNDGERSIKEILCEHKDAGGKHFAHGLCKACFDDFMKLSGGLQGGSAPPAFQRAENKRNEKKKRMSLQFSEDEEEDLVGSKGSAAGTNSLYDDHTESCLTEPTKLSQEYAYEKGCTKDEDVVKNEPESLSDIDDTEVTTYLNTEDEIRMKTIVWTEMNKDYLQEQEAKEAQLRAQAESMAAVSSSGTAAEIAAAAVIASKKTKRHRQGDGPKVPAETAAEATKQMLQRKRLRKLNLQVLDGLFDETATTKAEPEDAHPKHVSWAEEPPGNKGESVEKRAEEAAGQEREADDEEAEDDYDEGNKEEVVSSYSFLYEQAAEEEYEEY